MTKPAEQIPEADKTQYQIFLNCAANDNTLLCRIWDKRSKEWVTAMCGYHKEEDGAMQIWPIARVFTEEDFKHLEPPKADKP